MVREGEVAAAAVDVDRLAEVAVGHGRALDMPAGTALAPRRFPERLAGLGGFPECKVERVFLDVVDVDARAGLQIFDRLVAELAVVLEFQRAVVHVAVDLVGVALVDERRDDVDNLLDVFGRLRVHGRLADAERVGVGEVLGDVFFRDFLARDALFVCALDDLVVHVGEVLHERHLVAAVLEIAAQHVEHDDRARVADVDVVIHRRAAGVHTHLAGLDRHELFLLHGHGVEQFHIQTPLTDEFGIKKRPHAVRHERRSFFAVPLSFFTRCTVTRCLRAGISSRRAPGRMFRPAGQHPHSKPGASLRPGLGRTLSVHRITYLSIRPR